MKKLRMYLNEIWLFLQYIRYVYNFIKIIIDLQKYEIIFCQAYQNCQRKAEAAHLASITKVTAKHERTMTNQANYSLSIVLFWPRQLWHSPVDVHKIQDEIQSILSHIRARAQKLFSCRSTKQYRLIN